MTLGEKCKKAKRFIRKRLGLSGRSWDQKTFIPSYTSSHGPLCENLGFKCDMEAPGKRAGNGCRALCLLPYQGESWLVHLRFSSLKRDLHGEFSVCSTRPRTLRSLHCPAAVLGRADRQDSQSRLPGSTPEAEGQELRGGAGVWGNQRGALRM